MTYISSDTSVWIDFVTIGRIELPFRLPYTYIMNIDAIEDELLSPPGLGQQLIENGLKAVEMTEEEFYLAESYGADYSKLSIYDRIALAIAKVRNITLMTGDKALRLAAVQEGVQLIGTLGVLDQLWESKRMTQDEFASCLDNLLEHNGRKIRLPEKELKMRREQLQNLHKAFDE